MHNKTFHGNRFKILKMEYFNKQLYLISSTSTSHKPIHTRALCSG